MNLSEYCFMLVPLPFPYYVSFEVLFIDRQEGQPEVFKEQCLATITARKLKEVVVGLVPVRARLLHKLLRQGLEKPAISYSVDHSPCPAARTLQRLLACVSRFPPPTPTRPLTNDIEGI